MIITDTSVKRPVFAVVISLLLVAFGIVSFQSLSLREYPDIDTPIISISTSYRGASANVVESKITELIEGRISGVEGIKTISSASRDGLSTISIEFNTGRDIDNAANDIRDRIGAVANMLPQEADSPRISKVSADERPILWFSLTSDTLDNMVLTDYADRYLVDRLSSLDGVSRVQLGGALFYAMRIWVQRDELAARGLTVEDISNALREQNIELPAGSVQSTQREYSLRVVRNYRTEQQFRDLVIRRSADGSLIRIGDVARVEIAPEDHRNLFQGNGLTNVGIGIVKQSTANTLAVALAAKAEYDKIRASLPANINLGMSFDTSVFIEGAVNEVFMTLFIASGLVVIMTYLFLGDLRATLIPALTLPIALIATFIALQAFGYSLNLITLLALVLAIGLVVDDAIVVLENIYSRVSSNQPPLIAAYQGSREVGFAVVATSIILVAVFVPITFLDGKVGRLFGEFAITLAAAIAFSTLVALTLTPALSSKYLRPPSGRNRLAKMVDNNLAWTKERYREILHQALKHRWITMLACLGLIVAMVVLAVNIRSEYVPYEDRGAIFVNLAAPEGASFEETSAYALELESRLLPLVKNGEILNLITRVPGWTSGDNYNQGLMMVILSDWSTGRRDAREIAADIVERSEDITGIRVFPMIPAGLGLGNGAPLQFVLGGSDYEQLREWRDIVLSEARKNPNIKRLDHDHKENKPLFNLVIDVDRAGDLGVSTAAISRTLETFFGGRLVTTFLLNGEERNVIVQGELDQRMTPNDIDALSVRSASGALVSLANVVHMEEEAQPTILNRYNRIKAITLTGSLEGEYSLGEALDYLNQIVREKLPPEAQVDYKGESLDFMDTGGSSLFIFALALFVAYLVLAAQFESFIQPLVIMVSIPLSVAGALAGLYLTHQSFNIYSQVALVMLVGLSAKNGILIVEFINQLRDRGVAFLTAVEQGATDRLRPILMTSVTTAIGAIPLVIASGPGAESRFVIGVVIIGGVLIGSILTLVITPVVYATIAANTTSPEHSARLLDEALGGEPSEGRPGGFAERRKFRRRRDG